MLSRKRIISCSYKACYEGEFVITASGSNNKLNVINVIDIEEYLRGVVPYEIKPAIEKAWQALKSSIHKDGFIGYVQGSGDRPASSQPIDYNREPDFDDYALGLFLMGASEYCKMLE